MNFNIAPVGSAGVPPVQRNSATRGVNTPATQAANQEAVVVDAFPSTPPEEVRGEMATASASYDKLAAANQHISFRIDDRSGRLQIQVHDLNGNVLFDLPPDKALKAAADGAVD
jgi:uncharacterized FlaG/YvyC family protein